MITKDNILLIQDLFVKTNEKEILKGINLKVNKGEVHALMGTNGSGKSTLAKTLAGHPLYQVSRGDILFEGTSITNLDIDLRAKLGIFLGLQYPIEIPGVFNSDFLLESFNIICKSQGIAEMQRDDFISFLKPKMDFLDIDESFLKRYVNVGFSGGEKKKNEILQLLVLNPKLAILDETDSGLDIDALKVVSSGVNSFRNDSNAVILITHYQRLLDYIKPDFVHVLKNGQIVKSGDASLALELEKMGYDKF